MSGPRVSVGLPVYNGERYLAETIESLLDQTHKDFEIVISDNASTDRTKEICQKYMAMDGRIRYHRNPENLGAHANYNQAFLRARGVYFKWASSNDLCGPRFLEACVRALDEHPEVVLAHPRTRLLMGDSGATEEYQERVHVDQDQACERFCDFLEHCYFNNVMNGVIRAENLRHTGLMGRYGGADIVLMAELALYGKFVQVPEVLFFRRLDPSTKVTMRSRDEITRHYEPRRRRMVLQQWKFYLGCLSAVARSPVAMKEKACVFWFLVRRLFNDRVRLANELREAVGIRSV